MPRVTPAYRQRRRDEIVGAALRVLSVKGVHATSIADIVTESGLSAGAIYSHFRNKAELAETIAGSILVDRVAALEAAAAARGTPTSPPQVVRFLLGVFAEEPDVPASVLLQFWAEATTDPALHAVMGRTVARLRTAFRTAIEPWAAERAADPQALAEAMLTLCQGYIAHAALWGVQPVDTYLTDAAEALTVG